MDFPICHSEHFARNDKIPVMSASSAFIARHRQTETAIVFDRRFESSAVTCLLQLYDDLYLTEQPYGLVCGVETDLPAND